MFIDTGIEKRRDRPVFKINGMVLVIFPIILMMLSMGLVFFEMSINQLRVNKQHKNRKILAKAKQALVAYGTSYYELRGLGEYGFLPCPEMPGSLSTGRQQTPNCGAKYTNVIGRFTWYTLGLPPLQDADGECLWYLVSGSYKYGTTAKADMLNGDTPGQIDGYKSIVSDDVVALIIAPGEPLGAQSRSAADTDEFCRVDRKNINLKNYLDDSDQFVSIHQSDIFSAIQKRADYIKHMSNLTRILARCLASYGRMHACSAARVCVNSCEDKKDICVENALDENSNIKKCKLEHSQCLLLNHCDSRCDDVTMVPNSQSIIDQTRLPNPAPLDLYGEDIRKSVSYLSTNISKPSLLGRYMYAIEDGSNHKGNIFESCGALQIDDIQDQAINMVDEKSEYRKLWENWKDHFFYVVGKDFLMDESIGRCDLNCPVVGHSDKKQAAIVMFANGKLGWQQRFISEASKRSVDISDYLELADKNIFPDIQGNKKYQREEYSNDIWFCIDDHMRVSPCM